MSVIHFKDFAFFLGCPPEDYTLFHEQISTYFGNNISLPERRNKRKSVLEITKMYYF